MTYSPADFADDLHAGVCEARGLVIAMTGDPNGLIWPEYLVTVSVARVLAGKKTDWDRIDLEANVAETVHNALRGQQPVSMPSRATGRIDLVMRDRAGLTQPRYIVEVKDVLEDYNEVVKDIVRIEELLLLEGGSQKSSFQMGAIVLLVRKKNSWIHSDVLTRAADKTVATLRRQLSATMRFPHLVKVDWTTTVISDASRARIPTAEDHAEEGGPTVSGDEQLTIALVGIFYL